MSWRALQQVEARTTPVPRSSPIPNPPLTNPSLKDQAHRTHLDRCRRVDPVVMRSSWPPPGRDGLGRRLLVGEAKIHKELAGQGLSAGTTGAGAGSLSREDSLSAIVNPEAACPSISNAGDERPSDPPSIVSAASHWTDARYNTGPWPPGVEMAGFRRRLLNRC